MISPRSICILACVPFVVHLDLCEQLHEVLELKVTLHLEVLLHKHLVKQRARLHSVRAACLFLLVCNCLTGHLDELIACGVTQETAARQLIQLSHEGDFGCEQVSLVTYNRVERFAIADFYLVLANTACFLVDRLLFLD